MGAWLSLLRVKHYVKSALIFLPLIFSQQIFINSILFAKVLFAALAFCFVASGIYVVNDIIDKRRDAVHPTKRHRPIASGKVGVRQALTCAILLVGLGLGMAIVISLHGSANVLWVLLAYLVLNLGYCLYLKKVPIIEVAILASGFLLRVLYGGFAAQVDVSYWLYLTILSLSFYLGLGKRRNEFERSGNKESRKVLSQYNKRFLDRNMYMFLSLAIGFYSLWAIEQGHWVHMCTIPLVMVSCMRYSLIVEGNSDGDPTNVILQDKLLLILIAAYTVMMGSYLYFTL